MAQQVTAQITDDEEFMESSGDYDGDYSGDTSTEKFNLTPGEETEDPSSNLTLYLAVAVGGVGLIILGGIIFCCYRMKKKDEGDYKPGKPGQA